MKVSEKKLKAFTLLELMVVIAIIGIMSSISFSVLSGRRSMGAVEAAAREVAVSIREAQTAALTGAGAGEGCLNTFSFGVPDEKTYSINGCISRNYTLENGVVFGGGEHHESGSFSFTVPFAGMAGKNGEVLFPDPTVCPGAGDTAVNCSNSFGGKYIDIILKRDLAYYHVCLYPSGRVEEKPETNDVDGADCQ